VNAPDVVLNETFAGRVPVTLKLTAVPFVTVGRRECEAVDTSND
jgi:hypothetical protein